MITITTDHVSLATAARLSDRDLLDATASAAADERRTTAELIALLAEIDSRQLYLGEGYSSLFSYCRHRLHLAEFSAYSRITAARAARRFPLLLQRLADGAITLTSIGLLSAHLTDENHEALLDAVQHASKRDVECLVASLYGQPDIPSSVRRLPDSEVTSQPASEPRAGGGEACTRAIADESAAGPRSEPAAMPPPAAAPSGLPMPVSASGLDVLSQAPRRHDVVAPLAVGRFLLRVTIGAETHARLDKARDLLRHVVPNGDLALILDRALAVLVDQLERRKTGRLSQPARPRTRRVQSFDGPPGGRRIPGAVRREVWTRDAGRCAFVGSDGRCIETGFLEYHHVVPYARGGPSNTANIQLRCRAHNAYEAVRAFGGEAPA